MQKATLENNDAEELRVRADYLVGCDGVSKPGTHRTRHCHDWHSAFTSFALVHFRSSDLTNLHALGQFWHLFFTTGTTVIAQDEVDTWTLHVNLGPDVTEQDTIGDPSEFVRRALGRPVQIDEILACSIWGPTALLANSYGRGRILLAGDAVHTMIPTGGYGMNTALGDAFNLGWKLAAVVHGWGGQRLLDSYEAERRPIGERNRDASLENAGVHLQYHYMADRDLVTADTAAAVAHRAALAEFLLSNDGENTSLGIELDVRYDDSPVVCTPATYAPPWNRRTFVPTVRAGHRAPNIVVKDDRTLFDDFGPGFTLVDACRHPEAKRLIDEAALVGMPLHHLVVEDPHCRSRYQNQLVLVRPDLHIAWSGATVTDAAAIIERARGAT